MPRTEEGRARWALVVGPRGADRAPALDALQEALKASGLRAGGFRQRPTEAGGHDLVRVAREEVAPLSRPGTAAGAHEETFCSYLFDMRAFARARTWLEEDAAGADILFIDEVGKVEAAGKGHHDVLVRALTLGPRKLVVLSVRADQLFALVERLGLEDDCVAHLETPASPEATSQFVAALLAAAPR